MSEIWVVTRNRTHKGEKDGDGPLLTPEACNLDQAIDVRFAHPNIDFDADLKPFCKRCFSVKTFAQRMGVIE